MATQLIPISEKLKALTWRDILAFTLACGIVLSLPLIIFTLITLLIIRISIGHLAKMYRPDLGSLMSLASTAFATDLIFNKTPKVSLILAITLKGRLEIDQFRKSVAKLVNAKNEKGIPLHPELQQSVTSWLGLVFWKWVENFNIKHHVNIYEKYAKLESINEEKILQITNELLVQGFEENKSPWEFLVLYNLQRGSRSDTKDPQTLVILRTHHCVGDGFALLKLFLEDLSGETLKVAKAVPYKMKVTKSDTRISQRILQGIFFPFRVAHELMSHVIHAIDFNDWHIPEWRMRRQINASISPEIPLNYVKKIKNSHGTSFTAVPLAAFTGGFRNFMMDRGAKIPDAIHCLAALPYPGHPWKLRNHLTGSMIRLPLGIPTAKGRLQAIELNLQQIKTSTVPTTLFYLMQIAGLPFAFISYIIFRNMITTSINSNFPGPERETKFVGLPILEAGFALGFGSGNTGITFGSLSYNGNIRIGVEIDQGILPLDVPIKDLMSKIMDELRILDQESRPDIVGKEAKTENPLSAKKRIGDVNGNLPVPVSTDPSEGEIRKRI